MFAWLNAIQERRVGDSPTYFKTVILSHVGNTKYILTHYLHFKMLSIFISKIILIQKLWAEPGATFPSECHIEREKKEETEHIKSLS